MAKVALYIALLFVVVPMASLAERRLQRGEFSERCRIDQLEALEPTKRIEHEGGLSEFWDQNHEQFQCAGVAPSRHTVQPRSLLLPTYSSSPSLVYVEEGEGIGGLVIPGCQESFSSIQESYQHQIHGRRFGGEGHRQEDQHQKIHNLFRGQIIAVPAGVPVWSYNNGNKPLVLVVVDDTRNYANQLDDTPRGFFLGGNIQSESSQHRRGGSQSHRQGSGSRQVGVSIGNIFDGFNVEFLAEAFSVSEETARNLQSKSSGQQGFIIRVEQELHVTAPRSSGRSEGLEWEKERGERRSSRRGSGNGIEETVCNMRFYEDIGNPQISDVYSKEGGHLTTLNSFKLPLLQYLQLSAERGHLRRNAILAPHWNMNSHSIVYALSGSARVQVVDSNGNSVFDGRVSQGQILVLPQNFAVLKHAEEEDFVWVSFKTSDNSIVNQLAGKGSTISGLPIDVLANSFQISREEARRLKEGRNEELAFLPARSEFKGRRSNE